MITPIHKKAKTKYTVKLEQIPVFFQFGGPHLNGEAPKRKKVNFMVREDLLEAMKFYIPNGDRSDFVNGAVEESLRDIARKKAMDAMDELREKANISMTIKEFIRLKNYGRD